MTFEVAMGKRSLQRREFVTIKNEGPVSKNSTVRKSSGLEQLKYRFNHGPRHDDAEILSWGWVLKDSAVNTTKFDLSLVCNSRVIKISRVVTSQHSIFWKMVVSYVEKRWEDRIVSVRSVKWSL